MEYFRPEYLITPLLLYIGVKTTLTDIRTGKISNKTVMFGFVVGCIWNAGILTLWLLKGRLGLNWEIYDTSLSLPMIMLFNNVIGLLVAFGFWRFDLWSAGDGKLFAVYCFLIAPGIYTRPIMTYFPGFHLMFNSFICIFAFVFVEFIIRLINEFILLITSKEEQGELKKWFVEQWRDLIKIAMAYLLVIIIIVKSRHLMRDELESLFHFDSFTLYLILFVLFAPLHILIHNEWVFRAICAGLGLYVGYEVYLVLTRPAYELSDLLHNFITISGVMIFIILFRTIYGVFSARFYQRKVTVEELEPGMVLSYETVQNIYDDEGYQDNYMEKLGSLEIPLTTHMVTDLRTWSQHNEACDLYIIKHLPFAPGLFLGVILTLILRASLPLPLK